MHLRVSTVRRNDRVYRYAQLVESFRDKKGRPTKRVLRHLGALPEPVIEAFKLALKAGREGASLVLASDVAATLDGQDVANRRYLDLAVLIDCWRLWGLDSLLGALCNPAETALSVSQVVLPLVLQRCCAPGSKLEATRWVPRTALPEILGFEPGSFNNTRVHRTLEELYEATPSLQQSLADVYERREGSCTALFMDVTDTYFEGIGCPLAEQTRTKSEIPNKRCIAIVLLVNEHGYPMRWSVVGGKTKDWTAMRELLRQIGDVNWLTETPIVFDRAMGNLSTVAELKAAGLWFLTAAHVTSIESYTTELPSKAFADIELDLNDEGYERDIERVAQGARDAGFDEIHERLFAIDLGVSVPACQSKVPKAPRRRRGTGLAKQLMRAHRIRHQLEADPTLTQAAAAEWLGISDGRVNQLLALLRLSDKVQELILQEGDRFPLAETDMRPIFSLDPSKQLSEVEARVSVAREARAQQENAARPERDPIGSLRLVAYFNPRLFVDVRRRTAGHRQAIQRRVDEINEELAQAKRSRKRDATYRKFAREIERLSYLDTFDIQLEPIALTSPSGRRIESFRGTITIKLHKWAKRRKHDGFVLLLGHPELPQAAAELVQLYRDKDVVEKDFQTIKSFIKLRPLFHYTDPKVAAHVTICMLALLLQRTLRTRLQTGGLCLSPRTALDLLAECRLNERRTDGGLALHHITKLNLDQERVLEALDLTQLADKSHVGPSLVPRA